MFICFSPPLPRNVSDFFFTFQSWLFEVKPIQTTGNSFEEKKNIDHSLRKQPTSSSFARWPMISQRWSLRNERTAQIWVLILIGWSKFLTNQKHNEGLCSNTSSVWYFRARSSDGETSVSQNIGCFLRLHHHEGAAWLERRTCNSEAPSSSPALTASWICSR